MVMTIPRNRGRGRSPTLVFQSTNAESNDVFERGPMNNDNDSNDEDNSSVEPLDEDEQKALVEALHAEAVAQSLFFQKLFGYGIGGFATILSLCFPLHCPDECYNGYLCWIHAIFASVVHVWTVHPFILDNSISGISDSTTTISTTISNNTRTSRWRPIIINLSLQILPWSIWLFGTTFSHDHDHFHLGLMIGNLVTYLGAFVIQWDMESTNKALRELNDSQYKHKTL